ncbi:MAG TPA: hypothetical protein VHX68_14790 [Planctomycetaceae bacterium]|nr:hypothetical protein [Planctomycetaceae bacterium]
MTIPIEKLIDPRRIVGPSAGRSPDSITWRQRLARFGRLNRHVYSLTFRQSRLTFKLDQLPMHDVLKNSAMIRHR